MTGIRIICKTCFLMLLAYFVYSPLVEAQKSQKTNSSTKRIVINGTDGMQYDLVRFMVEPNQTVELIFVNKSEEPHNLLITQPGTRQAVVNAALRLGVKGKAMNFIPKSEDVLWSIPLINKGEKDTLLFKSPDKPGVYPYVCTYPGHGSIMYGAMYVMHKGSMPDISSDEHIPSIRRK